MKLDEMTWPEVQSRPLLVVPVGSCEQHGPHLPLGTDTFIATALCQRLVERLAGSGRDVVVAPAVAISASGEHAGFPGTLSIGTEATATMLVEMARSADWASGIVLVNGHGGNHTAVTNAVDLVRSEARRIHVWWPSIPGGDAHAGRTETSLMLAIHPALVRIERLERGETRPLAAIAAELRACGVKALSPNGVLGDPLAATLGEGIRLLDMLTDDLVASVQLAIPFGPRSETGENTTRRQPAL